MDEVGDGLSGIFVALIAITIIGASYGVGSMITEKRIMQQAYERGYAVDCGWRGNKWPDRCPGFDWDREQEKPRRP